MAKEWKKRTLEQWELINRLAARRFGTTALAEEAALFVMDSLAENSWQRVQSYAGKGTFQGFIASLSWRLLEDFSRKRFGRVRPPLWIRKLGGIWLLLFSFLCLERLRMVDAVESAAARYPGREKPGIEEAALTLLGRIPQCGSQQALEVPFTETEQGEAEQGAVRPPEQLLEKDEQRHFFAALFGRLTSTEEEPLVPQTFALLLEEGIALAPEERLLLKLVYQDNVGVTRAGRLLGLGRDQVNGRLRRLLARVRGDFQNRGVEEEVLEMLR